MLKKKLLFIKDKNYVDSFYLKIPSSILSKIQFEQYMFLKLLKFFSIHKQFRDLQKRFPFYNTFSQFSDSVFATTGYAINLFWPSCP